MTEALHLTSIIILKTCFYEGKLKIIKANGEVISAKLLYDISEKIRYELLGSKMLKGIAKI